MKKVVISLGGSVIVPDNVDYNYLKKFTKFIKRFSKRNKVVIVTGGGSTCRKYFAPLKHDKFPPKVFSLIGIATTRLNARLVAGIFKMTGKLPVSLEEVKKQLKKQNLVICGALGSRPNMTSDGNAAEVAKMIKSDYFINITNVHALHDRNPKKYKNAKMIPEISFEDFDKMISKIKFKPGQHFVLDQSAAKIIKKSKIKTYIVGKNVKNLKKLLNNKKYLGSIIH